MTRTTMQNNFISVFTNKILLPKHEYEKNKKKVNTPTLVSNDLTSRVPTNPDNDYADTPSTFMSLIFIALFAFKSLISFS